PYLASNNTTSYSGDDAFRNLREWKDSDRNLYLNVGAAPQRIARSVSSGVVNESVYIEQIGGLDANGLATIKITAFGYSRTYAHVAGVHAAFADGIDNVTIDPNVQIPVFF